MIGLAVVIIAVAVVVTRFAYWFSRKVEPERHRGEPPFHLSDIWRWRKKER